MRKAYNHFVDPDRVERTVKALALDHVTLFAQAYEAWFDEAAEASVIAGHVRRYEEESVVPFWLRGYVRTALAEQELKRQTARAGRRGVTLYLPPVLIFAIYLLSMGQLLLWA